MKLTIPPVVVFIFSLSVAFGFYYLFPEFSYDFIYRKILSRVFLVSGFLIAISAIVAFRKKGTTVDPMNPGKANQLVTFGIYQYTRNPMYLGMTFVLIGGVLRIGNPLSALALVFFISYLTEFQIKPEEESLTKNFGKDYQKYCQRVRRWI